MLRAGSLLRGLGADPILPKRLHNPQQAPGHNLLLHQLPVLLPPTMHPLPEDLHARLPQLDPVLLNQPPHLIINPQLLQSCLARLAVLIADGEDQ